MFIIGIDPHKGSHTAAVDRRRRTARWRAVGVCRSSTTRTVVALGGTVRTAVVGGRRRDRSRRVVGAAARRVGRDGRRCAGRAVGTGTAVGLGPQGQDRRARCPFGRDRRVAAPEPAGGRARGSPADLAAVGASSSPAHRGSDPCDLSVACRVVRDDRRRIVEESLGETGHRPSSASSARPTRSGSNANGSRSSSSTRSAASTTRSSSSTIASSRP